MSTAFGRNRSASLYKYGQSSTAPRFSAPRLIVAFGSVVNVLRVWIESYLSDHDNDAVLRRVELLASDQATDSVVSRQLLGACDRRVRPSWPNLISR